MFGFGVGFFFTDVPVCEINKLLATSCSVAEGF